MNVHRFLLDTVNSYLSACGGNIISVNKYRNTTLPVKHNVNLPLEKSTQAGTVSPHTRTGSPTPLTTMGCAAGAAESGLQRACCCM
jgi:hypothetical protein